LKLPSAFAMVHSKVVVIDPYGDHPVVMTGSHNMGPKASGVNDENLIIVEGDGDLASQYAGKIMEVYNQYRWRQSVQAQHGKPAWDGLADDDKWQIGAPGSDASYDKRRLRELDFWFGKPVDTTTVQNDEAAPADRREAEDDADGETGTPHRAARRASGHSAQHSPRRRS
jgi:phosphatidylserine/phosphatidylglycerophosphate/cardiolipin synthase-like enzyme